MSGDITPVDIAGPSSGEEGEGAEGSHCESGGKFGTLCTMSSWLDTSVPYEMC